MTNLLCSFDPTCGWRIRRVLAYESPKPEVVILNGTRYLRVSSVAQARNGQFCNPARLHLASHFPKPERVRVLSRMGYRIHRLVHAVPSQLGV